MTLFGVVYEAFVHYLIAFPAVNIFCMILEKRMSPEMFFLFTVIYFVLAEALLCCLISSPNSTISKNNLSKWPFMLFLALTWVPDLIINVPPAFKSWIRTSYAREFVQHMQEIGPDVSFMHMAVCFVLSQAFGYYVMSSPSSIISRNRLPKWPFMLLLNLFWIPALVNYVR